MRVEADFRQYTGSLSHLRTRHQYVNLQGPKLLFAKGDKHYPSRSGQTTLATAVTNITKPVTNNNFGPSTYSSLTRLVKIRLKNERFPTYDM